MSPAYCTPNAINSIAAESMDKPQANNARGNAKVRARNSHFTSRNKPSDFRERIRAY